MKRSLVAAESLSGLMTRDPGLYAKVVEFLEAGHSVGGTSALTGVARRTVEQVREVLGEAAVHAGIRRSGRNMVEAVSILTERLISEVHEIPTEKIPQALNVLIDKVALISGLPTQRVEVEHMSGAKVLSREKLLAMFSRLERKVEGSVVEESEGSLNGRLP